MANISDACLTLPLSAGEDTFELFTVKQELEYVEKQIRGLLVKQAELLDRRSALEASHADAHKSVEDAIISGFIHSGTNTTPWITRRKTRARTRATSPPLPVFEISTRNRFSPLREPERDDAVIIGTSMVRHVCATSGKGKERTHCFPGVRVLDVTAQVPEILNERFERWLSANEIDAEKKADVFLSVLGPTEYGLLKNLIAPQKVTEVSYEDVTSALSLHSKPKPILIAERFRFYKRQQKLDETVVEYILVLKTLASTCEFGQFLNDALRDQFVCGLSGEGYHKRILSEKDLTFKKACDIALALELAYKDTMELREHC
ncbi:hypothetical protein F2P79_024957 [Pimephales promelas]|nr:hypothetical protein F2P79_024957 [Pimephales promelas]